MMPDHQTSDRQNLLRSLIRFRLYELETPQTGLIGQGFLQVVLV